MKCKLGLVAVISIALLAMIALAGCGSGSQPVTTITGRATTLAGLPVVSLTIKAGTPKRGQEYDYLPNQPITDGDGRFKIERVPSGTFTLFAELPDGTLQGHTSSFKVDGTHPVVVDVSIHPEAG